jgi:hypothetical protein
MMKKTNNSYNNINNNNNDSSISDYFTPLDATDRAASARVKALFDYVSKRNKSRVAEGDEAGYFAECDDELVPLSETNENQSLKFKPIISKNNNNNKEYYDSNEIDFNESSNLTFLLNPHKKFAKSNKTVITSKKTRTNAEVLETVYYDQENLVSERNKKKQKSARKNMTQFDTRNKLNWWLSDSSLFETVYLENPFEDVHARQNELNNPNTNKPVQCPIQRSKLSFYETLLKKDLLNNSEYLFSSYIETIELANKLENFDVDCFVLSSRKHKEDKHGTKQKGRHISINHFAAIDKKYELVKLPRLVTRLPTIASRSNTILSNNTNTNDLALNTARDNTSLLESNNRTSNNNKMFDSVSIAESENFNEKENENLDNVSDFDQVNYLAIGLKYLENNTSDDLQSPVKKKVH